MTTADRPANKALEWLFAFQQEPQSQMLQDLLTDHVYLGTLDAVDPDDLLLKWANDPEGDLTFAVDRALRDLVQTRWDGSDENVRFADLTWHRMMRVAASLDQAPDTTSFLWERRFEGEDRLRAFVKNSARDALGWYWAAVSRGQTDTSLVQQWRRLCRLDGDTPTFHGRWGLLGLRRAPVDDPEALVVPALFDYVQAVDSRVERGDLDMAEADLLVTTEMNAVRRAYPSSERLREFWSRFWPSLSDLERDWVRRIFGVNS